MLVKDAIFLKYSLGNDLHLFQLTIQKGRHMLQPPREKVFTLISNMPRKRGTPSYLHQSPPTKMNENIIKTWKL
jgi:hypothetical protein